MEYTKTFRFGNEKRIRLFFAGWKQNPTLSISIDGDEQELQFHFSLFLGVWITLERWLPRSWYPTRISKFGYGELPEEKEISVRIHNRSLWWNFWRNDDEGFNKTWRKGCFHFVEFIIGRADCSHKETEHEDFILPYYEGNYAIRVIESLWTWKMRRRLFFFLDKKDLLRYEVKAGYQDGGVFIDKPIPHQGKGENSWDCGEDATFSISFGVGRIKSTREAALEFWKSTMKDRIRYGGKNWLPQSAKGKPIEFLKTA